MDEGECGKCSGVQTSRVLFPALPCIFGPLLFILFHHFSKNDVDQWQSPQKGVASTVFLTLIYIQVIGLLREILVIFPPTLKATWFETKRFVDIMSLLRPDCADFA